MEDERTPAMLRDGAFFFIKRKVIALCAKIINFNARDGINDDLKAPPLTMFPM